jgi:HSP90 family molecular chaperone
MTYSYFDTEEGRDAVLESASALKSIAKSLQTLCEKAEEKPDATATEEIDVSEPYHTEKVYVVTETYRSPEEDLYDINTAIDKGVRVFYTLKDAEVFLCTQWHEYILDTLENSGIDTSEFQDLDEEEFARKVNSLDSDLRASFGAYGDSLLCAVAAKRDHYSDDIYRIDWELREKLIF